MDEQDEEKKDNGGEQSTADKAKETVQDTANAVKDGANLAKNIASQNYVGAVKDAFNLLKNKKVRRHILISALMPIVMTLLIVCSVFAVFNAIGEAIENAINSAVEWFNNNYKYGVIYYTSEQLDTITESIQNLGIDLDDLNLLGDIDYEEDDPDREQKEKEALRKYLAKFLVAQERLRTLHPGENNFWDPRDWDNLFAEKVLRSEIFLAGNGQELIYGNVKVLRTFDKDVKDAKQLEYLFYENLKDGDGNLKITDGFYNDNYTVDSSGNLVFAKKVYTTTNVKKEVDGKKNKEENTEDTTYELETVDYKTIVDQYTTSVQFFIYLTMVTHNPEFSAAVADLAKDGEIQLVIMDDKIESEFVTTEEYTEHTQTVSRNSDNDGASEASDESEESSNEEEYKRENTTSNVTETTTKTEKRDASKINITYVDTWYAKQSITYAKNESKTTDEESETIDDEETPDDLPLTEEGEVSWKTNHTIVTQETTNKTEYVESVYGNVEYKTDKFIELLDKKFHIPNTTRSESAADNFLSGVDWLLDLMAMDTKSQKLEKVIKLIVNEYTNTQKYKITDLDNLIDSEITIDSSDEYFETGGIQNEEQRKKMQDKIEKELINTKVHSNNSKYQSGPFAKWWGNQINVLEKFQCTWWVYGRALMYLENIESPVTSTKLYKLAGNGGQWYDLNVTSKVFKYGSVPKPNSIISWSNGGYGHVAYVEGVASDGIYISHAGSGKSWMGITKIGLDGNVGWAGYTLNGYIYLDEPIT